VYSLRRVEERTWPRDHSCGEWREANPLDRRARR